MARQFEIDIQQFTPREHIDADMLSVAGLGIPPGTRFIDYRRNVSGRRVQVEWNGSQFVDLTDPK